jgi:hypothetical protein
MAIPGTVMNRREIIGSAALQTGIFGTAQAGGNPFTLVRGVLPAE